MLGLFAPPRLRRVREEATSLSSDHRHCGDRHPTTPCPQLPGTLVRIYIPAGAQINLLNLIEVDSPSGICLIVRLPFLGGSSSFNSLADAVRQAGGTIQLMNQ